jgi:hypothetical protein
MDRSSRQRGLDLGDYLPFLPQVLEGLRNKRVRIHLMSDIIQDYDASGAKFEVRDSQVRQPSKSSHLSSHRDLCRQERSSRVICTTTRPDAGFFPNRGEPEYQWKHLE